MRANRGHPARGPTFRLAAVVFVGVTFLFGLGLALRLWDLQTAANVAQLLSVLLAMAPLAPPLMRWWLTRGHAPVATPEDVRNAKEYLVQLLLAQWRNEARLRTLDDPDPIPVQWKVTDDDDLIDQPSNLTAGVLTVASSADVVGLVADFRRLRRKRMVILGGAGAGKTTLALQVLLHLLRTWDEDPTEPVPVLLSLAGWRPASDESFPAWLARRLSHDYPELAVAGYGPHVIHALADQGRLLPILDGLDETPPAVQRAAIEALNSWMDNDTWLILTSRAEEFGAAVEAAGRTLRSAVILQPEPLTPIAVADYLGRCLPSNPAPTWTEILRPFRSGTALSGPLAALAEVATLPLGLWLIRVTYITSRADPAPLLGANLASTEAMRAHLLDQLVRASVKARPPGRSPTDLFRPRNHYDAADVEGWLRVLASNLDRWGTRDFDWRAVTVKVGDPPPSARRLAPLLARVVPPTKAFVDRAASHRRWIGAILLLAVFAGTCLVGLLIGRVTQLTIASMGNAVAGAVAGWVIGIVTTLVLLVVASWYVGMVIDDKDQEVDWVAELNRDAYLVAEGLVQFGASVTFGLVYACVAGATSGLLTALFAGPSTGGWVGLVVGVAVGTAAACYVDVDRRPRRRVPWYGIGPLTGIISGIGSGWRLGTVTAALLLIFAAPHTSGGLMTLFLLGLFVLLTSVLVVFRAAVVPVAYTASSLIVAAVRAVLPRSERTVAEDPLSLWRAERAQQLFRVLRVVSIVAVVTLAVNGMWRAYGARAWTTLRRTPFDTWLAAHLHDFDIGWTGHLRYGFAAAAGLVLPKLLFPRHHGWRRWVERLLATAAVALVSSLPNLRDRFSVHCVGRFDGLHANLRLMADGQSGGWLTRHTVKLTADIGELRHQGDFRYIGYGLIVVLGILMLRAMVGGVEGNRPQVWWVNRFAMWRHARHGRLPGNLIVFLDDAHRLGLLRAVGTVYQFRHAELQDHLARPVDEIGRARRGAGR